MYKGLTLVTAPQFLMEEPHFPFTKFKKVCNYKFLPKLKDLSAYFTEIASPDAFSNNKAII